MTRTPQQFIYEIEKLNPNIEIIGKYTRAIDRVQVRCKNCGKIWSPKAYSLLQGKGCPQCSIKKSVTNNKGKTGLKSTKQFIEELKEENDSILVLGEYVNGHTNIRLCCKRCGTKWEAKPYSVLQGHGCPRCAKSGTSFMEQLILLSFRDVLGYDQVLSRDKKTIGLELDIVIPSLKLAIEPGNWVLHTKSVQRDEVKRELCAEKGYRLITIYDKFPKWQKRPFANDLHTFEDDLNKADHSIIRKLILDLFTDVGVTEVFSEEKWNQLESLAYENAKSMTHDIFMTRMARIHPSIEALGVYRNANRRIKVRCKVCESEWDAIPASLLSGDGCRKCGYKKAHALLLKSQREFENEICCINPEIEILGEYTGRHSHIRVKCKVCGFEWNPVASSLLRGSSHKGSKAMHKMINYKPENKEKK